MIEGKNKKEMRKKKKNGFIYRFQKKNGGRF